MVDFASKSTPELERLLQNYMDAMADLIGLPAAGEGLMAPALLRAATREIVAVLRARG
jgi:hypothetical protein